MKQTCNGCRAYEYVTGGGMFSGIRLECSLGYDQADGKPNEDCPKPRTIAALVKAKRKP